MQKNKLLNVDFSTLTAEPKPGDALEVGYPINHQPSKFNN
jgi:hypothetical protein